MFAWTQILEPESSSALPRLPQKPAAHRVPPGTCGQPVRTPLLGQDVAEGPPSSPPMGMATRTWGGTFHAKMGTIKDRNGMDLTEAEDIKKRWQEHTEELYKKDLLDPDNHNGVITDLEPDILECEVKWALGSITTNKASGGDRIPVELFKS